MSKKSLLAASLICMSSIASAEVPELYLGAAIGQSDFDISGYDDGTSLAFTLGIKVHKNFAFEASQINLGQFEDDIDPVWTFEYEGINLSLVVLFPINDEVEIFGKYGQFDWDGTLDQAGYGEISSGDGKDTSKGLGISAKITDSFSVVLEYQTFDVKDDPITNASIGARFIF